VHARKRKVSQLQPGEKKLLMVPSEGEAGFASDCIALAAGTLTTHISTPDINLSILAKCALPSVASISGQLETVVRSYRGSFCLQYRTKSYLRCGQFTMPDRSWKVHPTQGVTGQRNFVEELKSEN
jgi:hypothetical protein